ncbi:Krueppel-like factor 9 [Thelohanellus kitauei]|uniref:Krueppel-like factor 9 n=1 Tax=Thelohanellus kitauei TaxID=669202 RepID=A0A0C2N513_THEKT|nr:Krueppel-like factor 9 [Thelohanellus kitauei]
MSNHQQLAFYGDNKGEKAVFSVDFQSIESNLQDISDPENAPVFSGSNTDSGQHQKYHIYIASENNLNHTPLTPSSIRTSFSDNDVDALVNSSKNFTKSVKFDKKLFSSVTYIIDSLKTSPKIDKRRVIKRYRCIVDGCEPTMRAKTDLKYHYFAHCKLKPFKCKMNNCKARFSAKYNLTRHIRAHSLPRSFNCPLCDLVFDDVMKMNDHVLIHRE